MFFLGKFYAVKKGLEILRSGSVSESARGYLMGLMDDLEKVWDCMFLKESVNFLERKRYN
jgi:hypothetical protein